ncbi:MAG: hypothetical protein JWM80_4548 [Cyanobacteria bacterium RYN_339]|nr:hypothetical protein [Cyanobacteria bacterium RYN_339]
MIKRTLPLVAALLLAACSSTPATAPASSHLVNVTGAIQVVTGQLKGFSLQNVRTPYELQRLHHVDVYLTNVTDALPTVQMGSLGYHGTDDLSNDHSFDPIQLMGLKADKHYQVTLRAFQVDPALENPTLPVEVDDLSNINVTDLYTTSNQITDHVANGGNDQLKTTFTMQLRDQNFNGLANGKVSAVDGALVTTGAESMVSYRIMDNAMYVSTNYSSCDQVARSITLTPIGGGKTLTVPVNCNGFTLNDVTLASNSQAWNVSLTGFANEIDGQPLGTLTATQYQREARWSYDFKMVYPAVTSIWVGSDY